MNLLTTLDGSSSCCQPENALTRNLHCLECWFRSWEWLSWTVLHSLDECYSMIWQGKIWYQVLWNKESLPIPWHKASRIMLHGSTLYMHKINNKNTWLAHGKSTFHTEVEALHLESCGMVELVPGRHSYTLWVVSSNWSSEHGNGFGRKMSFSLHFHQTITG